jgi:hypothetical protein
MKDMGTVTGSAAQAQPLVVGVDLSMFIQILFC